MPYLNSVDITSPNSYATNNSFNQYLSQYHSAKLPIYDTTANVMHNLFFGGMSQFTLDNQGNLVEDIEVPFVKTISRITRDANGNMQEVDLGYIEMPALLGSGAEFIPMESYYYENHILDLNSVPNSKTLVGYIYGGIESTAPNIFFINDGTQSFASNVIFKVFINKSIIGIHEEVPLVAKNVLNLNVYPNPIKRNMNLTFFGAAIQDLSIQIFDNSGRLVLDERHFVQTIGEQEVNLNVSKLSEGIYTVQLSNGILTDQKKFIKQ
jgi:DNA-binding transcriptional regulator/RsmH inhibitor MraZ